MKIQTLVTTGVQDTGRTHTHTHTLTHTHTHTHTHTTKTKKISNRDPNNTGVNTVASDQKP